MRGPCTEQVPVRLRPGAIASDTWLKDRDFPGVRVVQQPLKSIFGKGRDGQVTVVVEPGARLVITPTRSPWRAGSPTDDIEELASQGLYAGAQLSRSMARKSQHAAGWLRTERDEPVLSVRITDRCPHDPSTYERVPCGHGFCIV